MPTLTYVAGYLESINKHYALVAGTLLGWYRDCGIIPHTTDMDVAITDNEYENGIKKHFINNKLIHLLIEHGLREVMYEMRLSGAHIVLDLFIFYRQNETHSYSGLQVKRSLYKYSFEF